MENLLHLPSGLRTSGFVEITLANGIRGIGEGYLAVFAPEVFRALVEQLEPLLLGMDVRRLAEIEKMLVIATGYWSLQGAARHAISAIEIALHDCNARLEDQPLWKYLGGADNPQLALYASGGDSIGPDSMARELAAVAQLGIETFKIRARFGHVDKVVWTQQAAPQIGIAVDMTQNLVSPSREITDVLVFANAIEARSGRAPAFLEEVFGPDQIDSLPELRRRTDVPIAGGEIVTTELELIARIRNGSYDIAQPDATVIGGIQPVLSVFAAAREVSTDVYVHCWGAGVGVLANYHAAAAAGGRTAEWPLPSYPLRDRFLDRVAVVKDGHVRLSDLPGLGVELTPEIEQEFAYQNDAVYKCLVHPSSVPAAHAWK
ncbi:mandelate racemase/muconate lactonizing enzyme family protein [Mycetocola miduiensis]|nr:mandelate racemase/muconate lactonizing enzyme family protein [Mycetocola miduiensis]